MTTEYARSGCGEDIADMGDLVSTEAGEARDREDSAGGTFGHGQPQILLDEREAGLPVVGNGVVHVGDDSGCLERVSQRLAIVHLDHSQMGGVVGPVGRQDTGRRRSGCGVGLDDGTPAFVPLIDVRKTHPQPSRLDLVESRVPPTSTLDRVPATPAVLPKAANSGGDLVIVGRDRTAVADRPEVLRRVETERCDVAECAGATAASDSPDGLCTVLDDGDPAGMAESDDLLYRSESSIEVRHHHGE